MRLTARRRTGVSPRLHKTQRRRSRRCKRFCVRRKSHSPLRQLVTRNLRAGRARLIRRNSCRDCPLNCLHRGVAFPAYLRSKYRSVFRLEKRRSVKTPRPHLRYAHTAASAGAKRARRRPVCGGMCSACWSSRLNDLPTLLATRPCGNVGRLQRRGARPSKRARGMVSALTGTTRLL